MPRGPAVRGFATRGEQRAKPGNRGAQLPTPRGGEPGAPRGRAEGALPPGRPRVGQPSRGAAKDGVRGAASSSGGAPPRTLGGGRGERGVRAGGPARPPCAPPGLLRLRSRVSPGGGTGPRASFACWTFHAPVSFSPLPVVCDVTGTFSGPGTGPFREQLPRPALGLHAHEAARASRPLWGGPAARACDPLTDLAIPLGQRGSACRLGTCGREPWPSASVPGAPRCAGPWGCAEPPGALTTSSFLSPR